MIQTRWDGAGPISWEVTWCMWMAVCSGRWRRHSARNQSKGRRVSGQTPVVCDHRMMWRVLSLSQNSTEEEVDCASKPREEESESTHSTKKSHQGQACGACYELLIYCHSIWCRDSHESLQQLLVKVERWWILTIRTWRAWRLRYSMKCLRSVSCCSVLLSVQPSSLRSRSQLARKRKRELSGQRRSSSRGIRDQSGLSRPEVCRPVAFYWLDVWISCTVMFVM